MDLIQEITSGDLSTEAQRVLAKHLLPKLVSFLLVHDPKEVARVFTPDELFNVIGDLQDIRTTTGKSTVELVHLALLDERRRGDVI